MGADHPSPATPGTISSTDYEELVLDPNGNISNRRLRDGRSIAYTYDALNRVTLKDGPTGIPTDMDVTYEYDLVGHLKRAVGDGSLVNQLTYDSLGRLLTDAKLGGTTSYTYDAAGRRTRMTWQDGFYVSYDYDPTGNVTVIRENGATSGAGVLATYAYDDLGRRTTLTRGNTVVTRYGYDAVSRLASLTNDLAGTVQDLTVTFGYNAAAQIVSRTASNDSYAWTGHYNVDRVYASNGLNQYSTAGGTSFGYDARGSLSSASGTSYTYTPENRLAATSTRGAQLTYEPASAELSKLYTADGIDRRFVTSGGQVISEIKVGTGLIGRYVFGPASDEPLVSYDASGIRNWLIADERGSIIAKTDAGGTATAIASYDDYGIPAGGDVGRFGYTGQAWLGEIGLAYYKARVYSPALGRFMQTDPIGYKDGINWYNYVGSDPINSTDHTGLVDSEADPDIVVTGTRVPDVILSFEYGFSFVPPRPTISLSATEFMTAQQAPDRDDDITVTGVRLSRDRILVDAAERAANSIPPFFNSALGRSVFGWLRGILIHSRFAANIRMMNNPMYHAEVTYLRGEVVPYGTPGGVRVDAVVGNIASPLFVIDLKTGAAILGAGQLNNYRGNVPPSALVQQILLP